MESRPRILVVDDDASIRTVFKVNLEANGYFVETAETGEEAIQKIINNYFDLMLIDIRLPDMMGTELLNFAKVKTPKMIKIMVTGYPTLENAVDAVNKGADGYVVKPVDMEELIRTIKMHLKSQRKEVKYSEEKVSEFIERRAQEIRSLRKYYDPISK
jgi:DNA-binding NtrC family response regulator